jgi:16S rRNA processing protein RimM
VSAETSGEFITLARVIKTQGRRGEVAVEVHSDVPDRFAAGMKLLVLPAAQSRKRVTGADESHGQERAEKTIEDLWPHKGLLVLKFRGIDSISDAEALIGSELQVRRSQRAKPEAGWTFISDLVGCRVYDHGREIGRVADVQFGAGEAPLLIVAGTFAGGQVTKYDVPFAEAYLEAVDTAHGEVRMRLPDGMLEVNAPLTAEEKKWQAARGKRKNR